MHKLVKTIIRNRTGCIFVSPHPDDAVFSAGGLLSVLVGRVKVEVINVFTSSGDSVPTLSAKAFLRYNSAVSPQELYAERKKEDREAFSVLEIKPVNLDMPDAIWRKYESPNKLTLLIAKAAPEAVSLYPTYRFHVCSGRLNKQDETLVKTLTGKIRKYLPGDGNYLIFCPVGIGSHVDHLVVRSACRSFDSKVIYWTDYPYLLDNYPDDGFIRENKLESRSLDLNSTARLKLSKMYKTQYHRVIRNPETLKLPEIYYVNKSIKE